MYTAYVREHPTSAANKEEVELQLLKKKNGEGCSVLDYLVKAFNIVRDEDVDEVTEAEVLEYVHDKDKPPQCFSTAHVPGMTLNEHEPKSSVPISVSAGHH